MMWKKNRNTFLTVSLNVGGNSLPRIYGNVEYTEYVEYVEYAEYVEYTEYVQYMEMWNIRNI